MQKKIDKAVIEHVKILCYEVVLGEIIDQKTRNKAKEIAEKYLNNNGYKIDLVKCDQENNPPDVVDSNKMNIKIVEQGEPNTHDKIIHIITL